MVAHACDPSYQEAGHENHLNLGGRGCGELRSPHCTPAWATRVKFHLKRKNNTSPNVGWMQWLLPVITALWEAALVDHLRSGVRDQPGQHGETPCLLNIQEN